ncbi:hypothetical protein Godav_022112 [Gossypium davidsonii]|uniref:Uncharacterized protein n=2 Tax=Gossypium TaxID=3633 RepID=A0A7J8TBL1_GOSDV|nr:hypothetical protein [Gossypium davidsonii]MBA0673162.1 hypothetical protein [Gossypium klotzschianum]
MLNSGVSGIVHFCYKKRGMLKL